MRPRGVGIVGAGVAGEMRAQVVARNAALRLIAIADVDFSRAERVASATGAKAGGDYRVLISDPAIDVLIVASPVQHHEEMVLAALDAGKDVLCEKPLSNTVESCRRMIDKAAAAGRVLAVGFNHRYYPCFSFLKQLVASGALGPIDHVRALAGHQGMSQFRAPWMYERATLGGGAMMDVGIHLSDLIQYLGFEAREVMAVVTNGIWNIPGSEDNAMLVARTAGNVPISYQATWSEWKGYRIRVEVYGRDGMALGHYPPLRNFIVRRTRSGGAIRREWKLYPALNVRERVRGWEATAKDAFAAELVDFVAQLDGAAGSCATGLDGLRAVAFAHAAMRSSETHTAVRLDG